MLPDGHRIRHFGLRANPRAKKQALPQSRKLLGLNCALPEIGKRSALELMRELTGIDLSRCPSCHQGTMIVISELPLLRMRLPNPVMGTTLCQRAAHRECYLERRFLPPINIQSIVTSNAVANRTKTCRRGSRSPNLIFET